MQTRNSRIGLVLFGVYLLLYGGFVFLNAFSPESMEATPVEGVNLAIIFGFGLILTAFVLALTYGILCRGTGEQTATKEAEIIQPKLLTLQGTTDDQATTKEADE